MIIAKAAFNFLLSVFLHKELKQPQQQQQQTSPFCIVGLYKCSELLLADSEVGEQRGISKFWVRILRVAIYCCTK